MTDVDTNDVVDISSSTFKFTVKRNTRESDAKALIEKSTGNGISILDGPGGKGQIDVIPDDTTNAPSVDQSVVWDLQIIRDGYPEILETGIGKLLIPVTLAAS